MHLRRAAIAALSLGFLVGSAQAHADEPSNDGLPPPAAVAPITPPVPQSIEIGSARKTEFLWYGDKILKVLLASDLVALSGLGAMAAWNSDIVGPALVTLGVGGHLLAGPIVHWSRGHVARGFGSLALHTLTPVATCFVGGFVGAQIQQASKDQSDFGWGAVYGGIVGLAAGAVATPIIDIGVLAHDPKPAHLEHSARALPVTLTVVPMVGASQWGLSVVGLM